MVVPTIGSVIMLRLATSMPLRMASVASFAFALLELQPGFARRVSQGLDSAVVEETAPVEDHGVHARCLRLGGDLFADLRGLGHAAALRLQRNRRSGRHRAAGPIVDEL